MSNPGKYGHNFTAYYPCTKASRKCANGRVFRTQTDAIIPGVFYIGYAKVLTLTIFIQTLCMYCTKCIFVCLYSGLTYQTTFFIIVGTEQLLPVNIGLIRFILLCSVSVALSEKDHGQSINHSIDQSKDQ